MSRKKTEHRVSIEQAIRFAMELHKTGKVDQAEGLYGDILAAVPDQPDALHYLGVLHYQRGRIDEAIRNIHQALRIAPDYVDAHNNLGNIYMEEGRLAEAEACYRKTISLSPDHVGAHSNLASVLRAQERLEEAESVFRQGLRLSKDFFPLHLNLGNLLSQQGRLDEAVTHYFEAVLLDPKQAESKVMLGIALIRLGRTDEAVAHFERWTRDDPDNPEARHLLAACSGRSIPGRASDDYIQLVFDRFADSFDAKLQKLNYRAPQLVAEAVHAARGEADGDLAILDAGCGTGLCGPLLKPFAFRLDGVDLSPGMLKKAAASKIYDCLTESDLTGYIHGHSGVYDVIVAADVLCYFGDLESVFAAVAEAIKPGGRFIFTVERTDEDSTGNNGGYSIIPQGRYTHSEAYIRRIASQKGLTPKVITHDVLRREMGRPVDGLVVTLARA
ncbi:hypothetical protein DSCO28_20750 [Desulfosarcina ovata subsp. sediminis]|uniref:Uncharacterized protein n=1 Tax=Desulfosarcina ovata subsp. sediminis TaxID=885957 RepID=A0A5K7ZP06_9BACT|nr:tetratricopeptide repeat protein [Desulfosarcina ovata]BBO81509.1 hypothetical protein DSCO28_20750 [Desulfosarcina ovata subsp. sediminis]